MNRDQARTILTPKQFEAWDLHTRGMGYKAISLALGISTATARDRVRNANHNLHRHRNEEAA